MKRKLPTFSLDRNWRHIQFVFVYFKFGANLQFQDSGSILVQHTSKWLTTTPRKEQQSNNQKLSSEIINLVLIKFICIFRVYFVKKFVKKCQKRDECVEESGVARCMLLWLLLHLGANALPSSGRKSNHVDRELSLFPWPSSGRLKNQFKLNRSCHCFDWNWTWIWLHLLNYCPILAWIVIVIKWL